MAWKNAKSTLDSYMKLHGDIYIADYSRWKNKDEWGLVGMVRDRVNTMYTARQSSCYLTTFTNSTSWDDHWDLVDKDYLMYSVYGDDDDFRSNLKSSMGYRTVAAISAKERKQEIEFLVDERHEDDEERAVVNRYVFQDFFRRNPDQRYKLQEVRDTTKIRGTGIAYVPYTIREREVEFPIREEKETKDDEGRDIETTYEKRTIIDYEDPDIVPVNLYDFYVDPNAQYLHGQDFAATDVAWITYQTRSQIEAEFGNDPDVKNLDKIKSGNTESWAKEFFAPPRDKEEGYFEVIRYYNVLTDDYIVIIEDVPVKHVPLPYQDKMLPFVDFRCVKIPGQFYGMGIIDMVLQHSSEESSIRNLQLDRAKITTAPPIFAGGTAFGELLDGWERIEPNKIIQVTDASQVKFPEFGAMPFDSFRILGMLRDEVQQITGISADSLNLPMSSTPATNTIAMKETTGDMVNMYSDNFRAGVNWLGRLLYSRFAEFFSLPSKRKSLMAEKKSYRELRLEDVKLELDPKTGKLKAKPIKGSSIIELKPDYFKWVEDPHIYISGDFVAPISKAWKMRKMQELLPQLAPFAGDPSMAPPGAPKPVVDIRKLVQLYIDEMEVGDKNLVINDTEDALAEINRAYDQQEKMQGGEDIPGVPGEPTPHRYAHGIELMQLNDKINEPEFQAMLSHPLPQLQMIASSIMEYRKRLVDHLEEDNMTAVMVPEASVAEANAQDQAMAQASSPMPMNNMSAVPTVSGNQGLPNQGGIPVPNKAGVEDVTGQAANSSF